MGLFCEPPFWGKNWKWKITIIIAVTGTIREFYDLTAPWIISKTYTHVAWVQSCANHMQHIEHLSHATCRVLCHVVRRDSSAIKLVRDKRRHNVYIKWVPLILMTVWADGYSLNMKNMHKKGICKQMNVRINMYTHIHVHIHTSKHTYTYMHYIHTHAPNMSSGAPIHHTPTTPPTHTHTQSFLHTRHKHPLLLSHTHQSTRSHNHPLGKHRFKVGWFKQQFLLFCS